MKIVKKAIQIGDLVTLARTGHYRAYDARKGYDFLSERDVLLVVDIYDKVLQSLYCLHLQTHLLFILRAQDCKIK